MTASVSVAIIVIIFCWLPKQARERAAETRGEGNFPYHLRYNITGGVGPIEVVVYIGREVHVEDQGKVKWFPFHFYPVASRSDGARTSSSGSGGVKLRRES